MSQDMTKDPAGSGTLKTGAKLLFDKLAAPFPEQELRWKPQVVRGNRALAIPYLDARAVADRLDDILGVEDWQDSYQVLPDGAVLCKLSVRLGERWIVKEDVGTTADAMQGAEKTKAAVSDAFKRAAVKFGIGRYLYRQSGVWVDYDPDKKQFKERPKLGAPRNQAPAAGGGSPPPGNGKAAKTPVGIKMFQRLQQIEGEMVKAGRCKRSELIDFVRKGGKAGNWPADFGQWSQEAVNTIAQPLVKLFVERHPVKEAQPASKAAATSQPEKTEQEKAQAANRPGVERISSKEADELYSALKNHGASVESFCQFYDIPRVDDLPKSQLQRAYSLMETWKASAPNPEAIPYGLDEADMPF